MKSSFFYLTIICLLSISSLAQPKFFTGIWDLDKDKSKLDEKLSKSLEGQTLIINQSDQHLRVEVKTKRVPLSKIADEKDSLGDEIAVYSIGSGFTIVEQETPFGKTPVTYQASSEKEGLKLNQSRVFNSPKGSFSLKVEEIWLLSEDGEILTIKSKIESTLEKTNSTLVYKKGKQSPPNIVARPISEPISALAQPSPLNVPSNPINAGAMNGKMINPVIPSYPKEAKEQKIRGVVKVRVLVDEKGKVLSAEAIEGEEILRKPAEEAAKATQFSPTIISGQPVKYTGIVIYNFR